MTATAPTTEPSTASRGFTLMIFVGLVLCWGLLWPAMKVAVSEIPVLSSRNPLRRMNDMQIQNAARVTQKPARTRANCSVIDIPPENC